MHLYSIYEVKHSERTVKVQNDIGFVLAHMQTQFLNIIGNELFYGNATVINRSPSLVQIYVDSNFNGVRDDGFAAYWFTGNLVRYTPAFTGSTATSSWQDLSNRVTVFTFTKLGMPMSENYAVVDITACFDPDEVSYPCGTSENPEITMRSNLFMPSVSVN
ncbi:MAG: hypothetical protein WDL87_06105 [Candidatus Omnitrophota bacterium]